MQSDNSQNEVVHVRLESQQLHINWYLKDEKNRPVCNFIPEVIGLIRVEGPESDKNCVRLQIHFIEEESVELIVPLSEIDRINWSMIDQRCIINSRYKNARGYIGNLIRINLRTAPTETRYSLDRLGINHIEDEVVFVAGNRVITRSSATELESKIILGNLSFRLDIDTGLTKSQTFSGMRELISLIPKIGRILVAHAISGITREAFKEAGFTPCAVLVIVGESGMLKSHYVPHIVQLYNRADEIRADTRFNSTQRFIEDVLYEHGECTTVIDDLHTAEARSIKRANETTAEEIIRRISDDTGRGHKEGNALILKKFRGNVVFIGEYIIGRESTMPRALIVNFTKRPNEKILDKYQRQQPLLVSTFYYFFIQWYVAHFEEICEGIGERLTNFRETTANSYLHGRLRDTQFYLQISYMLLLEFCKDSGFISEEDALDEYDDFRNQVSRLVHEQQNRYESGKSKAENIDYLKIIRKLYRKEKFRLADSASEYRPEEHDGLIYYECLCLRRKNLEKKLHKVSPDIKINDAIEELKDKNALKLVKDKLTVKISKLDKSVGAQRFYAIKLDVLEKKKM